VHSRESKDSSPNQIYNYSIFPLLWRGRGGLRTLSGVKMLILTSKTTPPSLLQDNAINLRKNIHSECHPVLVTEPSGASSAQLI
jgi:hypothetical protein